MPEHDAVTIELLPFDIGASSSEPHLRREILCRRPFREGGVRLEAERIGAQTVIHCYGHGGSGWTLAPGCGKRMLDLYLAEAGRAPNRDVTIIGAGVIGLFAAYYLSRHKREYPDAVGEITIVADRFEDLTSHNAGGLFEPFSIAADPDFELLADSYAFYHDIALGRPPEPEFEAFDIELLTMLSNTRDVMPSLVHLGYIPHGVPVTMKVRDRVHEQFVHQVFYMDVSLLMKHLFNVVTRNGVRTMRGITITDFSQVDTPVVVNCTGLGARELTGDDSLCPVLGHLIRFQNQPRGLLDMDHNLFAGVEQKGDWLAAVSGFLETITPTEAIQLFERYAEADGEVLRLRFPGGWRDPVAAVLDGLFEALASIRRNLAENPAVTDVDFDGLARIRVFEDQSQRNRFVDALSLIIRVAELHGETPVYDTAKRLYLAYLPRTSKRYIFLFEQDFPDPDEPGGSYTGLSYFMPILHDSVCSDGDGRYRYVTECEARDRVTAGIAGGTTIRAERLGLRENQREFDRLIDRLRYWGF